MADNKDKRGKRDRVTVAAGEGYEVNYFRQKHGITAGQAREIIMGSGTNNRDKLNKLAEKAKKSKRK